MKKNLIILFALLFISPVFGQKNKKDIVYLKSGGIIKGQLITKDSEKVKINSAGNQWVFRIEEVDSISKHANPVTDPILTRNYFFDTSLGVLAGNSYNEKSAPFSFMTSLNYRVVDKLYVGAGLGTEFLQETYMPAFAQFQYKFRDTRFTPFVNLQMGYEVPLEKNSRNYSNSTIDYSSEYYPGYYNTQKLQTEGGFLINPSIGFQKYSSENFGWFFSFGYRYHQLNYSGNDKYKLESNYSRLSLKIGIIFN